MKKQMLLAVAFTAMPLLASPAVAQESAQTVVQYKVDIANVAVGYRASKLVGASVVNDAGDKIGAIDDLIVTRNDKVMYAIIAVGGFLGVGDKLVAVPFSNLQFTPEHTMLMGATKESLKALPKFTYAK